jgi:hypothetical protein
MASNFSKQLWPKNYDLQVWPAYVACTFSQLWPASVASNFSQQFLPALK